MLLEEIGKRGRAVWVPTVIYLLGECRVQYRKTIEATAINYGICLLWDILQRSKSMGSSRVCWQRKISKADFWDTEVFASRSSTMCVRVCFRVCIYMFKTPLCVGMIWKKQKKLDSTYLSGKRGEQECLVLASCQGPAHNVPLVSSSSFCTTTQICWHTTPFVSLSPWLLLCC